MSDLVRRLLRSDGSLSKRQRRIRNERTKAALEEARARGVKLGRPSGIDDATRARILERRAAGATLAAIAVELNEAGIATAQGGACWRPSSVAVVLKREKDNA